MKKILVTLLILGITSCNQQTIPKKTSGIVYSPGGQTITEITVEGCQYIGHFDGSNTDWGTHKGNCDNPIHQTKIIYDTVEYKLIRE